MLYSSYFIDCLIFSLNFSELENPEVENVQEEVVDQPVQSIGSASEQGNLYIYYDYMWSYDIIWFNVL